MQEVHAAIGVRSIQVLEIIVNFSTLVPLKFAYRYFVLVSYSVFEAFNNLHMREDWHALKSKMGQMLQSDELFLSLVHIVLQVM